ncbi:hypothetical protein COT95_02385 [Candidatus Falkowbacteria bacterium CG10_big_fil_rev_8_21_14_0_10_37_6]|uniref:Uncharacterized protein n=1 Tax=Candidatus Falkowbacteria bacterium CG10_big_fil_rev_8_21_14_0_10_37_6 TaxID=1974563 RepID=A0A2H0V6P3_9BACT|nr:MAG: hypothetical protein COT95_02385 [Candidatus Falkowbacteria bacterium CG10_big_fil_rev_8_21_14_0_10_37_6]
MPAVDFDSADPNSYKNLADVVYTSSQFSNLMWSNKNLTLNNPITYVSGDVVVEGGQNLTINGLLVVERDFKVGKNMCWNGRCGTNNIIVNHTLGSPSGILAKRKVEMDLLTGLVNITGIVYANDEMKISGIPFLFDFEVYGALVSRKLTITSVWQNIDIYYDSDVANNTFEPANFSPIINIKYWEEKY